MAYSLGLLAAGTGFIHLAAARDHVDHPSSAAFFVAVGVAQLAWAGLVVRDPARRVLAGGVILSLGVAAAWVWSRGWGLPVGHSAGEAEAVGWADLSATMLELAVAFGAAMLLVPGVAGVALPRRFRHERFVGAVGLAVTAAVMPALVLGTHPHEVNGHDIGSEAAAVHAPAGAHEVAVDTVAHPGTASAADGHASEPGSVTAHPAAEASAASPSGDDHAAHDESGGAAAPIATAAEHTAEHAANESPHAGSRHGHGSSEPCVPTAEEQAAADDLVERTRRAIDRYRDHNQVLLDGYVPFIAPANWYYHYLNYPYVKDRRILDPDHPESLLIALTDQGYVPIGALYIMPSPGMHGPAIGGCLTYWHAHDSVVIREPWEKESPEMLHVMTIPIAEGPFGDPSPREVRALQKDFDKLFNPWWRDGCAGLPWIDGDPYRYLLPDLCEDDDILSRHEPG
jgi:hypothetical protein